jgi:hypothetical protein
MSSGLWIEFDRVGRVYNRRSGRWLAEHVLEELGVDQMGRSERGWALGHDLRQLCAERGGFRAALGEAVYGEVDLAHVLPDCARARVYLSHTGALTTAQHGDGISDTADPASIGQPNLTSAVGQPHRSALKTAQHGDGISDTADPASIGQPNLTSAVGQPHRRANATKIIGNPHRTRKETSTIGKPHHAPNDRSAVG